jgi:hypothetical protein
LGSNAEAAMSDKVVQMVIAITPVCQLSRRPAGFLFAEVAATHDDAGLVAALAIDFPDDDRAVRIATP